MPTLNSLWPVTNADGTLDASFSGDGKATTDLTSGHDFANAITAEADGSLVLGGSAWPRGRAKAGSRFAMVRYTPEGTLDASFGGDGKVLTKLTRRNDSAQDVAVQTDGKIVAAGVAGVRELLQTIPGMREWRLRVTTRTGHSTKASAGTAR